MLNRVWKSLALIALIFNLCLLSVASAHDSNKSIKKAAEFALKDQFGNELSVKFPREKTMILAIGDKDGSEQLEDWIRPLAEKYADRLDIQGVAELSSVPNIARGVVRNFIKKKSARPVMLDWSGEISKSYDYEKDKANLILIDKSGNIINTESGAASAARLEKFYKEIDKLLQ